MTKSQKCKLLNLMENSTHLLGAHILVPNMLTYHKKKDYEIFCVFTLIGHLSQCIESYTAVKFTNYKTERIHSRQICKRVAKVKVALMENSPHLLGVHIHIS